MVLGPRRHPRRPAPPRPDVRMQQATVNLFADMGAQPGHPPGRARRPRPRRPTRPAPTSTITTPAAGATVHTGGAVTDHRHRHRHRRRGRRRRRGLHRRRRSPGTAPPAVSWTYTWTPGTAGTAGQHPEPRRRRQRQHRGHRRPARHRHTSSARCSLWGDTAVPAVAAQTTPAPSSWASSSSSTSPATITGIRFYKGAGNTGHARRPPLDAARARCSPRRPSPARRRPGWQQVDFATPVAITANTTYVVSYYAPAGGYAVNGGYFDDDRRRQRPAARAVQHGVGRNGVYVYGGSGFPTNTFNATNYWVDVVFDVAPTDTTPADASAVVPPAGRATGVADRRRRDRHVQRVDGRQPLDRHVRAPAAPAGGAVAATVTYNAATRRPRSPRARSPRRRRPLTRVHGRRAATAAGNAMTADVRVDVHRPAHRAAAWRRPVQPLGRDGRARRSPPANDATRSSWA